MFIDEVKIKLRAWKWWDWIVSWRREKCIPNWWPFWGNWWKWADIILQANPNINTLIDFRHKKLIKAENGEKWWLQERAWIGWVDLVINVPVWTIVRDASTWEFIYDLSKNWERLLICRWWRWGYWNSHFATSTRQAPKFAELWDIWEEIEVNLELKLVADIWIIWLPNAWKSTLIKTITNVKPKIASYPFTTIIPNLWVMEHKWKSLVIEDVPWLIKWASHWKWLWLNFLKHIERTRVLLHLLDLQELDKIIENYNDIRNELKIFSEDLASKKEIVVLSKSDLFDKEMIDYIIKEFKAKTKIKDIFVISAPANIWIEVLKDYLVDKFANDEEIEITQEKQETVKFYDLKDEMKDFEIIDNWNLQFEVKWERIEQIVRMTDMKNLEAVLRVYDVMTKMWITKKIDSIIRVKYEKEVQYFLFENEKWDDIFPKVVISGRVFTLDKLFLN
ncbi:MAG: GTPase ObgE [uncultured bacterium (gcode 4)]|uniref:GTPase ObgE n=1 Tax=uncultured bacterium (gcode 4) TaxID=1234023 RepID=K2FYP5_9BACT|nr:MAG: GTPase ObgE [uncultured bacterium (gcode 4)]